MINFEEYIERFKTLLNSEVLPPPYDDEKYFNYLKLNFTRHNRWLKSGEIQEELANIIEAIEQKQKWIVITEPWCGDAAHTVPFIYKAADVSSIIELYFSWRDETPSLIDKYLTNGTKSIPKLIVRDENDKDLFTWGARPAACQKLYKELENENESPEEIKMNLQKWYNKDKGISFQKELAKKLKKITSM